MTNNQIQTKKKRETVIEAVENRALEILVGISFSKFTLFTKKN